MQLIDLVFTKIKPDLFIVRGDNILSIVEKYKTSKMKLKIFDMHLNQKDVVDYIINLDSCFIVGIGNIVGWGDEFLDKLKDYRANV